MKLEWSVRLRHPAFWTGIMSALVLLTQQLGWDIFPENIADIVNTVLIIATMLGVVVDSTTEGLSDKKPISVDEAEEPALKG